VKQGIRKKGGSPADAETQERAVPEKERMTSHKSRGTRTIGERKGVVKGKLSLSSIIGCSSSDLGEKRDVQLRFGYKIKCKKTQKV